MPFVGSNQAQKSFIVDYECSFVDDYLRVTEHVIDFMSNFPKFLIFMCYMRPVNFFLIIITFVSIGKLRQKPNSKLFLIYATFRLLYVCSELISMGFKMKYSGLSDFVIRFINVSSFFWLAIASYDYMINIR